jgi:hypothetical protein
MPEAMQLIAVVRPYRFQSYPAVRAAAVQDIKLAAYLDRVGTKQAKPKRPRA